MTSQDLENYLFEQIPLARQLGARVNALSDKFAVITAPLEPNRNHMQTAFGGSLQCLLILAAYAWLYNLMKLNAKTCHLILQKCEVEFLKPVSEEIFAKCFAPTDTLLRQFLTTYDKKGMARLELKASIGDKCKMTAWFVAKKETGYQVY